MRAVKQRGIKTAFVVGIEDLRRADAILAAAGPRRYQVMLKDGREFTAKSLDELFKISDLKVRHIRRLEIATDWREILRASLTLQRDRKLPALAYDLVGEERSVVQVAEALDDWMKSVRAWYSRLATMDWMIMLVSTWLTVVLAVSLVALVLSYRAPLVFSSTWGFSDEIAAALWTIPLLLGTVLNFLRNGLFPIGTYLVRDEASWNGVTARARKVVGGGFLLSLIAAFLTTLVASVV